MRAGAAGCERPTRTPRPSRRSRPRSRQGERSCACPAGAFAATTFAASEDATIGAMSCEPHRGCSFGAGVAAVLVRPDRDVLGAVIRGEVLAAQRERGGQERDAGGGDLARGRARASSGAGRARRRQYRESRRARSAARTGSAPAGSPGAPSGEARTPRRARSARAGPASAAAAAGARCGLRPDATVSDAVLVAHRAAPRRRPVHEHAVLERHPAEPDWCLVHVQTLAASARSACLEHVAAGPRSSGLPSISTSGISSRTDDEVKASSAASSRSSG